MNNRILVALSAATAIGLSLTGCVTTGSSGSQSRVAIADTSSRAHLEAELTMGDLMAFAENVTNKMLADPKLGSWPDKRPKLIVGHLLNNTDDPNLPVQEMYDRVQEVIFNAGIARIVDSSATDFDYIVRSEVTSVRQYGKDGEQLAEYRMNVKMYTLLGELVGQWSDRLNLAQAGRSMF